MRGLATEREFARIGAVERSAEREQIFDARRRIARQNFDDRFVTDTGPGPFGVDCMQARRIVFAHGGGDSALRPIRRRSASQSRLAEHRYVRRCEFQRRHQTGDAGADDHDAGRLHVHARDGRL